MKLENQVVSLELAKKLKELGFEQDSLFYWGLEGSYLESGMPKSFVKDEHYRVVYTNEGLGELTNTYFETFCSAFTVAELGEMLPPTIEKNMRPPFSRARKMLNLVLGKNEETNYVVGYESTPPRLIDTYFHCRSEADARAKCLIWLKENGYLVNQKLQEKQ